MHNVERALIHLSEVDVIRICQGISSTGSLIIVIDYLIFFSSSNNKQGRTNG